MRFRKLAILLLAGALAAGLGVGMAGAARASSDPTIPSPDFWAEIFTPFNNARSNTMCVDDPGGATRVNTQLQFFHCHGYASNGAPQRWLFIPEFPGDSLTPYLIQNTGSGLCISYPFTTGPFMVGPGTHLAQQPCNQSAVEWTLHAENDNGTDPLFQLIAFGTNLCMSAGDLSDSNNTPLEVNTCLGFTNPAEVLELG